MTFSFNGHAIGRIATACAIILSLFAAALFSTGVASAASGSSSSTDDAWLTQQKMYAPHPTISGSSRGITTLKFVIGNTAHPNSYTSPEIAVGSVGAWSYTIASVAITKGEYNINLYDVTSGKLLRVAKITIAPAQVTKFDESSVSKMIADLKQRLADLQGNMGSTTGSVSSETCSFHWYRSLKSGSQGSDVKELQMFLKKAGFFTGDVTGYFGPLTLKAVQQFQKENGVVSGGSAETTGYGSVGAMTRLVINKHCAALSGDEKGADGENNDTSDSGEETSGSDSGSSQGEGSTSGAKPSVTINKEKKYAPTPTFTGTAKNISAIQFAMANEDHSTPYKSSVITVASDGTWSYSVQAPDFIKEGLYAFYVYTTAGKLISKHTVYVSAPRVLGVSTDSPSDAALAYYVQAGYYTHTTGNTPPPPPSKSEGSKSTWSSKGGDRQSILEKLIAAYDEQIANLTKLRDDAQAKLDALKEDASSDDDTSFTIDDVRIIVATPVDPSKNVADDEYTLYTIMLKTNKTISVKECGYCTQTSKDKAFTDAGYEGDVAALRAKAVSSNWWR